MRFLCFEWRRGSGKYTVWMEHVTNQPEGFQMRICIIYLCGPLLTRWLIVNHKYLEVCQLLLTFPMGGSSGLAGLSDSQ